MVLFEEKRDEGIGSINPYAPLVKQEVVSDLKLRALQRLVAIAIHKVMEFLRCIGSYAPLSWRQSKKLPSYAQVHVGVRVRPPPHYCALPCIGLCNCSKGVSRDTHAVLESPQVGSLILEDFYDQ